MNHVGAHYIETVTGRRGVTQVGGTAAPIGTWESYISVM